MKARQLITPCLIFKNHCTPLDSSRDGSRDDTFVLWARDEFDGLPVADFTCDHFCSDVCTVYRVLLQAIRITRQHAPRSRVFLAHCVTSGVSCSILVRIQSAVTVIASHSSVSRVIVHRLSKNP